MKDSRLEGLLEKHQPVHHHDPLDIISDHVVLIVFISLLFMASVFMFLSAEPSMNHATAYAIIDYPDMPNIFESISGWLDDVRSSNDRPYFLLSMFVCWIMVVGLINIALHEREYKR